MGRPASSEGLTVRPYCTSTVPTLVPGFAPNDVPVRVPYGTCRARALCSTLPKATCMQTAATYLQTAATYLQTAATKICSQDMQPRYAARQRCSCSPNTASSTDTCTSTNALRYVAIRNTKGGKKWVAVGDDFFIMACLGLPSSGKLMHYRDGCGCYVRSRTRLSADG